MWSISYVTFVDIVVQVSLTPWSIFLFFICWPKTKINYDYFADRPTRKNSLDCPHNKKLSCLCLMNNHCLILIINYDIQDQRQ